MLQFLLDELKATTQWPWKSSPGHFEYITYEFYEIHIVQTRYTLAI